MEPFDTRLKQAVVAIAGVGGLGSTVAAALARASVGRLILVDFDRVEPSNLNRQHYTRDQIGQPKALAMQTNLQRINPEVQVDAVVEKLVPDRIVELFGEAQVVAECFDRADQKQMLVETVLTRMSPPIVAASGLAGYGQSNTIQTKRLSPRLMLVGDGTNDVDSGLPLCAGRVWIAAAHQANAIIELLIDEIL